MKTIDLSPSQYRVVSSSVECSSAVSSAARASRMSQSQATTQSTTRDKPAKTALPDTHPIYGIVNLALLAVTLYLLWANFL